MAGGAEKEEGRRATIEVVDREVPVSGWQQIDLPAILSGLPPRSSRRDGAPTRIGAASVISFPGRQVAPLLASAPTEPKRIPSDALVGIGRPGAVARRRFGRRGEELTRSANDNVAPKAGPKRSLWRELFFLVVLAATVACAFWSGRVHGLQRIIVVPESSSVYSVVT